MNPIMIIFNINKCLLNLKNFLSCIHLVIIIGFTFILSIRIHGQTLGCNYKAGNFSMTLEGHTTGVGFTSQLVLTDGNGIIKYVTSANSTIFQNVVAGDYIAYGITYQNATHVLNLSVGSDVNLISGCFKTVRVPTKVCDCNNQDGNLSTSLLSGSATKQINYLLTDGKGTILLIKSTPSFSGNSEGVYNIITTTHDINGSPINFENGKNILLVSGSNFEINKVEGFIVCSSPAPKLSIIKDAPAKAFVGDNFTYTFKVNNISNVATTGKTILTDTLAQGLNFEGFVVNPTLNWTCQSKVIIVNNSAVNLVSCENTSEILPNSVQEIFFSVKSQKTGTFLNQGFIEGGGTSDKVASNKVTTLIEINDNCKEICVPFTIIKTKK
jgi:uncharacterized repeat protein (TIGR01451 family)